MVVEKDYKGACELLNASGTITNVATSFSVKTTPSSNWPTGSSLPFVICFGRGTATEEVVLCSARAGATFTVTTRGYAGTTAVGHSDNETVEHVVDALALADMIHAAANTTGVITTAEDLLVGTGNATMKRLAKGGALQFLQMVSGAVGWAAVQAGSIPAGALAVGALNAANQIANGIITDVQVAAANKDGVAGTASMRTLGAGSAQAAAGNDARLSDTRTPTAGSVVDASVSSSAAIALSKLATDPLARANHTGTQTASTISNFDTQVRTSRLDQMAAPTASVSANSQKITSLATPTASADAATKGYIDGVVPTALSTYTPVVRQGGSSKSLTVNYAKYAVNGHICTVWFDLTINASGSGAIDISMPVACDATAGGNTVGLGGVRHFRLLSFSYLAEAFSDTAVSTRCALDFSTLIATQNLASGDNLHGILNYPV